MRLNPSKISSEGPKQSVYASLTPAQPHRAVLFVLWALSFPSRASSSNSCALISVSFWTHFKEREKGLKPGIKPRSKSWFSELGFYYIWECFEFRISGASSWTLRNLRDGNSSGINTALGSKPLTSGNAELWVQSEFREREANHLLDKPALKAIDTRLSGAPGGLSLHECLIRFSISATVGPWNCYVDKLST